MESWLAQRLDLGLEGQKKNAKWPWGNVEYVEWEEYWKSIGIMIGWCFGTFLWNNQL